MNSDTARALEWMFANMSTSFDKLQTNFADKSEVIEEIGGLNEGIQVQFRNCNFELMVTTFGFFVTLTIFTGGLRKLAIALFL